MPRVTLAALTIVLLLTTPGLAQDTGVTMTSSKTLIDFTENPPRPWYVVNDGVMGGLSDSGMRLTPNGTGEFSGVLSLENNGGFASVRTPLLPFDYAAFTGVQLRVKGDGRTYQLRFRTDERFDGVAYRALFPTQEGVWTTVLMPFEDFQPTFRGRILEGVPPLDTSRLEQLTLMVADKKAGPFLLEVGSITAVPLSE